MNTYKMFLEAGHSLLRQGGRLGLLVPSSIYSDKGAGPLRRLFSLRDYPSDVMCLYAEGFSVANFLVSQSDRRTFLNFIHFAPLWWLVFVATVVTELGLGFLLAYGLITKFTSGQAADRAGQVHTKLATYQGSLGLTAIGLAVLFMLMSVTRGW